MEIKIVSKRGNPPEYKTCGSAGFDISAFLEEPITLKAGERRLIPTGLFLELPPGYEAQVRGRSGLALNHGIGLANGIGTIDPDYRGEIGVILINWGDKDFVIKDGDRIAQIVINRYEQAEFNIVNELGTTERGDGGFGHTGVK